MPSPAACAAALAVNAGLSAALDEQQRAGIIVPSYAKGALASYFLVNIIFSFTYTPLQGVVATEALETTTRAKGLAASGVIVNAMGFINQFATEKNASGALYLASPILSGWASIMSVGQIIGMTTLPFVTSRFGRKPAMYVYWVILALSVMTESLARSWPHWLIGKLLAG